VIGELDGLTGSDRPRGGREPGKDPFTDRDDLGGII